MTRQSDSDTVTAEERGADSAQELALVLTGPKRSPGRVALRDFLKREGLIKLSPPVILHEGVQITLRDPPPPAELNPAQSSAAQPSIDCVISHSQMMRHLSWGE